MTHKMSFLQWSKNNIYYFVMATVYKVFSVYKLCNPFHGWKYFNLTHYTIFVCAQFSVKRHKGS